MTDAFGCVALVAMAPIISIQICGLIYKLKTEHRVRRFVTAKESFIDYGYEQSPIRKSYKIVQKSEDAPMAEEENADK